MLFCIFQWSWIYSCFFNVDYEVPFPELPLVGEQELSADQGPEPTQEQPVAAAPAPAAVAPPAAAIDRESARIIPAYRAACKLSSGNFLYVKVFLFLL